MCVAHLQRGDSLWKELRKHFSPVGLIFYPSYFMRGYTFENFILMEICSYSEYYLAGMAIPSGGWIAAVTLESVYHHCVKWAVFAAIAEFAFSCVIVHQVSAPSFSPLSFKVGNDLQELVEFFLNTCTSVNVIGNIIFFSLCIPLCMLLYTYCTQSCRCLLSA